MRIIIALALISTASPSCQTQHAYERKMPPLPPSPREARRLAKRPMAEFINVISTSDEVSVESLGAVYAPDVPAMYRSKSIKDPNEIRKLIHILQSSQAGVTGVIGCMTDRLKFKYQGRVLATMDFCEGEYLRFSIPSPDIQLQKPKAFQAWFGKNKIAIALPQ